MYLRQLLLLIPLLGLGWTVTCFAQSSGPMSVLRNQMVRDSLISAGIANPRVIKAMRTIPRHEFVPRQHRPQAYLDMALPIGESQTISSPFIVAFMTECIDPQRNERVLEIGTGSGYQAAVLSALAAEVFSIEIVEPLGRRAAKTLKRLRLNNVHVKLGDGFQGWPEHAPFDKIIVTCSPEKIPAALIEQLREGGRMVIPVGERYQQTMTLLRKENGKLKTEALRPTLFVPMTGTAETRRDVRPDPGNPQLMNGGFETQAEQSEFVFGWYYQRQAKLVEAADAPEGNRYLKLTNQIRGRDCHLMQGLAIDGRSVERLRFSAWGRARQIAAASDGEGARVVVSFYDENRRDLGQWWLGPWKPDGVWRREEKEVRVPMRAREAIVRIGLFGSTGEACFDELRLQGTAR
ncbi:MAG: protein-L-isoaspartate(D-aspartate) O-methyltransferase [Planctomycetaceae bacterium]|nr:protein-L-isoaspartate(D-aspartate) O-methyltransferase [Planctomycetaceae bacterium]